MDSDQALDWLADNVTDTAGANIRQLIDAFNKKVENEGDETDVAVDLYGYALRAAADVVVKLNFFSERLYGDLHADLAEALGKIIDTKDWIESWNNPDEVVASINDQIRQLKEGPDSTTLFANLNKLYGGSDPD
jgi:hypothetical protein